MPRAVIAFLLLCGTAHAAPEQRQQSNAQASTALETAESPAVRKAQEATAARDKAWDKAMKKTMSGICRGC